MAHSNELNEDIWHLKHEIDSVFVYTKKDPHHSLKEIKLKSTINGESLSSFVALFQDLDSYTNWVYSCNSVELLERVSDKQIIYYFHAEFPWPLNDRDFVIYNEIWQNNETGAFHSRSKAHNNYLNEKKGLVRVTYFSAEWVITPIDDGTFDVSYTFSTDPAGNIPTWIVNTFAEFGPLKTINQMELQAQKEKYSNANFSYITEYKPYNFEN